MVGDISNVDASITNNHYYGQSIVQDASSESLTGGKKRPWYKSLMVWAGLASIGSFVLYAAFEAPSRLFPEGKVSTTQVLPRADKPLATGSMDSVPSASSQQSVPQTPSKVTGLQAGTPDHKLQAIKEKSSKDIEVANIQSVLETKYEVLAVDSKSIRLRQLDAKKEVTGAFSTLYADGLNLPHGVHIDLAVVPLSSQADTSCAEFRYKDKKIKGVMFGRSVSYLPDC